MKISKITVPFILAVSMLSTAVYAVESTDDSLLQTNAVNDTAEVSDDVQDIELFDAKNKLPSVSFEGLSAGQKVTYSTDEEKVLNVNAYDSDGSIEKIEIYRYEELVEVFNEQSCSVNLDNIGITLGDNLIKAVAYDNTGASSTASVLVEVKKYTNSPLLKESDFVKSGNYYGELDFQSKSGYITTKEIDSEHGNSLVLGMDENGLNGFTRNDQSLAQCYIDTNYPQQLIEFDVCITCQPVSADDIVKFGTRKTGGVIQEIMTVNKDGLAFPSGTRYAMDENDWHHVSVIVSFETGSQYFTVSVDGETVANRVAAAFTGSSHFRFFVMPYEDRLGEVAIDNFEIFSMLEAPTVAGVGSHDEIVTGGLDRHNKELGIYLSNYVNRDDINSESVKIFAGKNALDTELIRFNSNTNCIEVTMADDFEPNAEYRIRLSEDIRFEAEYTFGLPLEYRFTTLDEGLTVKKVTPQRDGENINITVETANLEENDKDMYVFVSLFDNEGRLCKTKLFKDTLAAGSRENTSNFQVAADESVHPYIFIADAIQMSRIYYGQEFSVE